MSLVSAKCPNCGASIQVDNERQDAFCSYCGSKVAVQEAVKLVKLDNSEELANLYQIARRAKEQDNSENAAKYYDMILVKDPDNWEPNFYVVYYQAMSCKIAGIWSAANSINKIIPNIGELVSKIEDEKEQETVVTEITAKLIQIATMLFNGAVSHYKGIDASIKGKYTEECRINCDESVKIMLSWGDLVEKTWGEKFSSCFIEAWKAALGINTSFLLSVEQIEANNKIRTEYTEKIKKYDETYEMPELKTSGCYVATAVYGSYDCPEVWTLRRFRDNVLDETWYGRAFIKSYYATSPTLVKWFGKSDWFKSLWRKPLDKLVISLTSKGFKNTPYQDKY